MGKVTPGQAANPLTVGDLRIAIDQLPDDAAIIIEGGDMSCWGQKFVPVVGRSIGSLTDDPGLVLKVVQVW